MKDRQIKELIIIVITSRREVVLTSFEQRNFNHTKRLIYYTKPLKLMLKKIDYLTHVRF
jgi:hypothetical protein